MPGMNRNNGQSLSGLDHLTQSIGDIVGTPIGTRIERRTYGAYVFDLIDAPGTPLNAQRIIAATATAIAIWEPRIRVDKIQVSTAFDGRAAIEIDGETTEGIKYSDVIALGAPS